MCQNPINPNQPAVNVPPATGSRRRRLWELDKSSHCPVLGVCLPVVVLRRVVEKTFRGNGKNIDKDHELHSGAVGQCSSRTALAEGIQRELERRYAGALRQVAGIKSTDALAKWWAEMSQKDLAGPLWATLT